MSNVICYTKYDTESKCQQDGQHPKTPSQPYAVPHRDALPKPPTRRSKFDKPIQDLALEPRLDLETAPDPRDEHWRPSCNPNIEPLDGGGMPEEDEGSVIESSEKG